MRKRSKSREYALQLLYQLDVTRAALESTAEEFWAYHRAPVDVRSFADALVRGTRSRLEEIDQRIASCADNWEIGRMAVVDRNILRLGAYELLYTNDIPPKVALNEAVELAKRFGDEESSRFVNGILDGIHRQTATRSDAGGASRPSQPSVSP